MPFPDRDFGFPTKDEMADYLEAYVARFQLPVRTGERVERVARRNGGFVITTGSSELEAENVVIAMATFQQPHVPDSARELDARIVQLHSFEYRQPSQLADGPVLIVGAATRERRSASRSPAGGARGSPADVGQIPFA
jgi:putative flavoprotein involved in K+ transport